MSEFEGRNSQELTEEEIDAQLAALMAETEDSTEKVQVHPRNHVSVLSSLLS
jgi:hypothetical protein